MRRITLQDVPNFITGIGIVVTIGLNIILWFGPYSFSNSDIFYLVLFVWLTDLADGFAAFALNAKSKFGAFLDQARDKFFGVTMFAFVFKELWIQGINRIRLLIILILVGEAFLSYISLFSRRKKINVSVHWTGKFKASFYFTSIGLWFYVQSYEILNLYFWQIKVRQNLFEVLFYLLAPGLIFAFLSIWVYIYCYRSKKEREEELK